MTKSVTEIHDLFRSGFNRKTRQHLVRSADRANRAAMKIAAGYHAEQARDLFPYLRRADFENRIRDCAILGVSPSVRLNCRRTSSYVELSTDDVVVTALTRSRPPKRLAKALYRETLAKSSQCLLFDDESSPGDRLYSVFIYGGGNPLARRCYPLFANVYFPIPGWPLLSIPPLDIMAELGANETGPDAVEPVRPAEETIEVAIRMRGMEHIDGE